MAASFDWCELMQPVDLVAELAARGFAKAEARQLLDAAPPLEFDVCIGGRCDCRARGEVLLFPINVSCSAVSCAEHEAKTIAVCSHSSCRCAIVCTSTDMRERLD